MITFCKHSITLEFGLTFSVQKPEYFARTRPIQWLLMHWSLASPGARSVVLGLWDNLVLFLSRGRISTPSAISVLRNDGKGKVISVVSLKMNSTRHRPITTCLHVQLQLMYNTICSVIGAVSSTGPEMQSHFRRVPYSNRILIPNKRAPICASWLSQWGICASAIWCRHQM